MQELFLKILIYLVVLLFSIVIIATNTILSGLTILFFTVFWLIPIFVQKILEIKNNVDN